MEKRKLIDLSGLKQFLSDLKDWVANYFDSRVDKTINKTSNNPVANSVVSKAIWCGKEADIEAAIASGDIIPGYTVVRVTDDDNQDIILDFCTQEDIYRLFGLSYVG